ncbi:MAG: TraR/DksA family transcriptional regulator [Victivallales bacterium]|nr:TraR/DksA family transcriptional regulator [Victivallales bacterium]
MSQKSDKDNASKKTTPQYRGEKKKYYEALIRLREQVIQQLKFHSDEALNTNDNAGEKNGMSTHMADLGSDNFLHDMELSMLTSEGDVLEMIDEALDRLASGEYGKCMDCSADIGPKRLEAKPYAMFCVNCKAIREKHGGLRPDLD